MAAAERRLDQPLSTSGETGAVGWSRRLIIVRARQLAAAQPSARDWDDRALTERTFTLEEANEALVEVRPLAETIIERRLALSRALEVLEKMRLRVAGNGGNLSPLDIDAAQNAATREAAEIARCVQRITELGAQVKDLELGLVDFPSHRGGEEILLCWHVGEEEIGYWHGVDEGFAGRKELD